MWTHLGVASVTDLTLVNLACATGHPLSHVKLNIFYIIKHRHATAATYCYQLGPAPFAATSALLSWWWRNQPLSGWPHAGFTKASLSATVVRLANRATTTRIIRFRHSCGSTCLTTSLQISRSRTILLSQRHAKYKEVLKRIGFNVWAYKHHNSLYWEPNDGSGTTTSVLTFRPTWTICWFHCKWMNQ